MKVMCVPVGPEYKTNCYIVAGENGCVVIDPGYRAQEIYDALESIKMTPSHILLTHGHFDHIGGVSQLRNSFKALVAIGRADAHRLRFTPDILVDDGMQLKAGDLTFSAISVPGHTEGGVAYIAGDCLFSGDTLFCGDVGRTDLPGGNREMLLKSLAKLSRLEGNYIVYPGHEEASTLDAERATNPYLIFAAR